MIAGRGFTLIEAIITIVVLAIAVPSVLAMVHDASLSRIDASNNSRAVWLTRSISEQLLADASSDHPALGMAAFDDPHTYLHSMPNGLRSRLRDLTDDYATFGIEWSVILGDVVSADLSATADPSRDLYRPAAIVITIPGAGSGPRTMQTIILLTDTTR